MDDVRQFALDLYTYKVGQKAEVGVLRNGQVQTHRGTVVGAAGRSGALRRHGDRARQS